MTRSAVRAGFNDLPIVVRAGNCCRYPWNPTRRFGPSLPMRRTPIGSWPPATTDNFLLPTMAEIPGLNCAGSLPRSDRWRGCPISRCTERARFIAPLPHLCTQERFEFRKRLFRRLLWQKMAAGQGFATDVHRALTPSRYDIVHPVHGTLFRPEREKWTSDLVVHVSLVVHQVNRCGSAVILAGRVNGGRVTEAAQVLGERFRSNCPRFQPAQQ